MKLLISTESYGNQGREGVEGALPHCHVSKAPTCQSPTCRTNLHIPHGFSWVQRFKTCSTKECRALQHSIPDYKVELTKPVTCPGHVHSFRIHRVLCKFIRQYTIETSYSDSCPNENNMCAFSMTSGQTPKCRISQIKERQEVSQIPSAMKGKRSIP